MNDLTASLPPQDGIATAGLGHPPGFWQAALDALPLAVAVLDGSGRVVAQNSSWSEPCAFCLGVGAKGAGADAEAARLRREILAVAQGRAASFEGEFERPGPDGSPCFYAVRASRLGASSTLGALGVSGGAGSEGETAAEGRALVSCEDVTQRHLDAEAAARQAAEAAARERSGRERADFLARAGEVLASSLDLETTLSQAARLCVPYLADWCLVDLAEGDSFRRVAIAFSEEEDGAPLPAEEVERRRELAGSYRRVFSLHGDVSAGVVQVIRTGESEMYPLLSESDLHLAAHDEAHVQALRDLRIHSAMCLPLSTRGRILGALTFVRTRPVLSPGEEASEARRYTEEGMSLAQDVARVAALAVDNARLFGQAEAASRAKDDFLAILSHELRTPLTPILGWVYLLREEKPEDGVYHRALDIIEANARAQSRLIEDLIDVSRVVMGKLALEKRTVSLAHLAHDVAESARPHAQSNAITLDLEVGLDHSAVLGDEGRLRQALSNLVANAIKFTPRGGRVLVRLEGSEGRARLVVSDSGRGIEEGFLPRLFERFEQAEPSAARGTGGLGLGLTIVRHIARLHGGEVSAHSDGPGRGATFTLELPLLPPAPATSAPGAPPSPALVIEGAKILVVDDEPEACEVLETMLTRAGAVVKTAHDTEEAWQVFQQWRPDILAADLAMPGEDGHALIRRVRALSEREGGRIPALAITALARPEDKSRALEAGFHLHVPKPLDPAKLALALLELLSLARAC